MVLIKSISGIRGTLGGVQGDDLTAKDVRDFVSSYALILKSEYKNVLVVVGRDARQSGKRFIKIVIETLLEYSSPVE